MEGRTNVISRNWKSNKISVEWILPASVTYLLGKGLDNALFIYDKCLFRMMVNSRFSKHKLHNECYNKFVDTRNSQI